MPHCSVTFVHQGHTVEYGAETSLQKMANGLYADVPFLTIDTVVIALTPDLLHGWNLRMFGDAVRAYVEGLYRTTVEKPRR